MVPLGALRSEIYLEMSRGGRLSAPFLIVRSYIAVLCEELGSQLSRTSDGIVGRVWSRRIAVCSGRRPVSPTATTFNDSECVESAWYRALDEHDKSGRPPWGSTPRPQV